MLCFPELMLAVVLYAAYTTDLSILLSGLFAICYLLLLYQTYKSARTKITFKLVLAFIVFFIGLTAALMAIVVTGPITKILCGYCTLQFYQILIHKLRKTIKEMPAFVKLYKVISKWLKIKK